ncbi:MAG: hypothetical protein HC822_14755 [Oscillochloris sp.]|nr:hypothetical protein [Oscillochloris sp.]
MTQRERIHEEDRRVGVYDAPDLKVKREATETYRMDTQPADEIRWGPVIAGIFTVLTTLLTLSVLGLAIGFSAFDAGDPAGAFGMGAGIWGLVSALIAFGLGGYVAGATARVRGGDRGLLNGAMVWIVTIPLSLFVLSAGVGSLLGFAGNAATAAGAVAGSVVDQAPGLQATAQAAGDAVQNAVPNPQNVPPDQVNQAANTAGRTAWGTLLWLGLAAAAAMAGGFAGGKVTPPKRRAVTQV